jgi:hypothetical protein
MDTTSALALTAQPADTRPEVHYARIAQFSAMTGIKERAIYELLAQGRLRGIKCQRATLVDVKHALKWLDEQPQVKIRPMKPPRDAPPDHQAA